MHDSMSAGCLFSDVSSPMNTSSIETFRPKILLQILVHIVVAMGAGGSLAGAEDGWEKRILHEITLNTPTPFVERNEVMKTLPQSVRDQVAEYDMQVAVRGATFGVAFARKVMKEGQKADLEDSLRGALTRGNPGLRDQKVELIPTKIDGLEARRASVTVKAENVTLHYEALAIQQGQKIWIVSTVYSGEEHRAESARVLESVRVTK
jgi:hypothetical protein